MCLTYFEICVWVILIVLLGQRKSNDTGEAFSLNDTTVMRGLAIIFVVIHHTSTWLGYRIPLEVEALPFFCYCLGMVLLNLLKRMELVSFG